MVNRSAAALNGNNKSQKSAKVLHFNLFFSGTLCCSQFIRGVYLLYRSKKLIIKIELIDQSG